MQLINISRARSIQLMAKNKNITIEQAEELMINFEAQKMAKELSIPFQEAQNIIKQSKL